MNIMSNFVVSLSSLHQNKWIFSCKNYNSGFSWTASSRLWDVVKYVFEKPSWGRKICQYSRKIKILSVHQILVSNLKTWYFLHLEDLIVASFFSFCFRSLVSGLITASSDTTFLGKINCAPLWNVLTKCSADTEGGVYCVCSSMSASHKLFCTSVLTNFPIIFVNISARLDSECRAGIFHLVSLLYLEN